MLHVFVTREKQTSADFELFNSSSSEAIDSEIGDG